MEFGKREQRSDLELLSNEFNQNKKKVEKKLKEKKGWVGGGGVET